MVNVFGRRPQDGFAGRPVGNIGFQYGLKALLAGKISLAQFLDLNQKIGAYDIDYNHTAARMDADRFALKRVYKSGAVDQADNLDKVAIIDMRGPDPGAFHDVYRTYVMRARLDREHGTHANQVLWRGQVPIAGDPTFTDDSIVAIDQWLRNVEKDKRRTSLASKILRHKPKTLTDRCTDGNGNDVPAAECDAVVQAYSDPQIEGGMPKTDDTLRCNIKPLRRSDYANVTFTDAQWTAMQRLFPNGICDFSKPGVDRVKTTPWQTYQTPTGKVIYGGRGLGARPASRALVCAGARPYARFARGSLKAARRRGAGRRLRVRGTAGKRKTCGRIKRVQVAVARRTASGKRCRHLGPSGRFGKPRSCRKPHYLRARGTRRWRFASRRALRAGTYVVRVRARDSRGKRSVASRRRHTTVTITLR
jgi:hypothetical protein